MIVLIVAVVVIVPLLYPAPAVQVQAIYVWAPDNVCGLNTNPIGYYGYNSSTSAVNTFDLEVENFNGTTCTVVGVTTNSSGFALSQIQVPLVIAGGTNNSMNLTVTSPSSSFSGILNLVFS